MNDTLILFIAIIISAGIGAFIGLKFAQLKSKSDKSTLEERNANLQQQLTEFKQFSEIENQKQDQYFNQQLKELRENIRNGS